MKRRLLVIAMMLMLALFVTACGKQEVEDEIPLECPPLNTEVTEDPATVEEAFAEVLEANEEAIKAFDRQRDINGGELINNVLVKDLNGDGSPELMFMAGDTYSGDLHIYTMKDGKAVECEYDVSPKAPYIEDNKAAFAFNLAGGGANYMIYTGKEDGVFYATHQIWDTTMSSRSIKYSISKDGVVKAETVVCNVYNIEPSDTPFDTYEIDNKSVEQEEGVAEFASHRNDYSELLMYNMSGAQDEAEDFKVYENLKTDKPLAGSYDDVMEQLTK